MICRIELNCMVCEDYMEVISVLEGDNGQAVFNVPEGWGEESGDLICPICKEAIKENEEE